jgi:hypothetical protein
MNENLSNNEARKSVDSIDWLDESYVERVAKECNMSLMYDDDGDYYDANVEYVVKFAQEIAKAAIQANH